MPIKVGQIARTALCSPTTTTTPQTAWEEFILCNNDNYITGCDDSDAKILINIPLSFSPMNIPNPTTQTAPWIKFFCISGQNALEHFIMNSNVQVNPDGSVVPQQNQICCLSGLIIIISPLLFRLLIMVSLLIPLVVKFFFSPTARATTSTTNFLMNYVNIETAPSPSTTIRLTTQPVTIQKWILNSNNSNKLPTSSFGFLTIVFMVYLVQ
jgi:hypothetical protein